MGYDFGLITLGRRITRCLVLVAAENAPQTPKPLAAPLLGQPFGGVSISLGFTDRHYELPRKVDAKKQEPAPRPVEQPGRVMRGA